MTTARARALRRYLTESERRLWSALRDKRLLGFKFRRQHPVGPFIVDFICLPARLVIELDGSQHHDEEQFWYDYRRTKFLEMRGLRVLRFRNIDILKHPAQCVEQIADAACQGPHPSRREEAAIHLRPEGEGLSEEESPSPALPIGRRAIS